MKKASSSIVEVIEGAGPLPALRALLMRDALGAASTASKRIFAAEHCRPGS